MRRRLVLFLIVFGVSLTLLAVFVAGDQIVRDVETATIGPQDDGLVGRSVEFRQPDKSVRIGKPPDMVTIPVGDEARWTDQEGVTHVYHTAIMELPGLDVQEDGLYSEGPVLTVYGDHPGDITASIRSGNATISTHGSIDLDNFDQSEMPDVRSAYLGGTVVAKLMGTDQDPGLVLTTEELNLELPPGWDESQGFPPVVLPRPLELRRSDDSLILRGSAGEFDAVRRRVVIQPPVEVVAMVDGFGEQIQGILEEGAEQHPLILRCKGELEYSWTAPEGQEDVALDPKDSDSLEQSMERGELTLRDEVHAQQGERWMRSEFLRVAIGREQIPPDEAAPKDEDAGSDEDPAEEAPPEYRYRLEEFEAYDHRGRQPVQFALFGGTGRAGRLTLDRPQNFVEFRHDVHFEDLQFGEGEERIVLRQVDARDKVSFQGFEEDGETVRLDVRLLGEASLEIDDLVQASAGSVKLLLIPGEEEDAASTPGDEAADPASDRPDDEATPARALAGNWSPERLELREDAHLKLAHEGRLKGEASAQSIDYFLEESGRNVLILGGDAHCFVDGEQMKGPLVSADVHAPDIELRWVDPPEPSDPEAPEEETDFDLSVAELVSARFELEGVSLDSLEELVSATRPDDGAATQDGTEEDRDRQDIAEADEAGPDAGAAAVAAAEELQRTTLQVTPSTTCRLDASPEEVHFLRRAQYETVQAGEVMQRVWADRFDAEIPAEQDPRLEAQGDVVATSLADGFELRGDRVDFGAVLVAEGRPAVLEITPEDQEPALLEGDLLQFDPERKRLHASMRGPGLVHLRAAAGMVGELMVAAEEATPEEDASDGSEASPAVELPVAQGSEELGLAANEAEGEDEAPEIVDLWCRELIALHSDPAPEAGEDDAPEDALDPRIPFSNVQALGLVRLERDDGSILIGDRLDVDVRAERMKLSGRPAEFLRPSSLDPQRHERAEAEWIEAWMEDESPVLVVAPRAVLEFLMPASKLREPRPEDAEDDPLRKIRVQTGHTTTLRGDVLTTDGGVETLVFLAEDTIRAFSERLEVRFDGSPLQGGIPLQAFARRFVTLDHPWFRCHGALLSFDFQEEWFELKAGSELCHVEGSSSVLPIQAEGMEATFRRMKCRLRDTQGLRGRIPIEDLYIQGFDLRPRGSGLASASGDRR